MDSLLAQLTLEEKLLLVAGTGFDTRGVERLGIPKLSMTDGPVGVRNGAATAFPAPVALAASFDPELVQRVGAALGRETRAKGKSVLLAPCVNLQRTPQGGRNFESFGEDPWLASRIATSYIRGVQSEGVAATVKHFAINNQETERMTVSVEVSERALHELYFPAFKAAVQEAGVLAVMCSYNRIGGTYACEHPGLLGDTLKQRWGFEGLVMSDWGATHSTAAAASAGLDLEMPTGEYFSVEKLHSALDDHSLNLQRLDDMVRRQLRVLHGLHLLPGQTPSRLSPAQVDPPEHRAINRQASREGLVLLKNTGSLLPLEAKQLKRVAVIGPRAAYVEGGGGSALVKPTYRVSPLDGLREALGSSVVVDYAPGEFSAEHLDLVPATALAPPGKPTEQGLLAQYYTGIDFSGTSVKSELVSSLDWRWDLGSPDGLPADQWSIRFTGTLTAPTTGRYILGLNSDDGSRLWLDGKLLVDNWGGHPMTLKTAEVELKAGVPHELRIDYYETILGAGLSFGWQRIDNNLLDQARKAARSADASIIVVGDTEREESEGIDRSSLLLPGNQEALLQAVLAENPRTIVVVATGAPVLMGAWLPKAPAVIQSWFGGQEFGHALADVLLGTVSPSGKLPVTLPKRWEDCPAFDNFPGSGGSVRYDEELLMGYRFFDTRKVEPEYPFGFGLTYSRFEISDFSVLPSDTEGNVSVSCSLRNAGSKRAAEVLQVYVHDAQSDRHRPEQELKAFARQELEAGESKRVTLRLAPSAFARYDLASHDFVRGAGAYEVRLGTSSRELPHRSTLRFP